MLNGDYVCIVESLTDAFRPPLLSNSASDLKLSTKMFQKSEINNNPLRNTFINDCGIRILSKKLTQIVASDAVQDFPVLSVDNLRSLTFSPNKTDNFIYT